MTVVLFVKENCLACKIVENFFCKYDIVYEKRVGYESVPLLIKDGKTYYPPLTTRKLKGIFLK